MKKCLILSAPLLVLFSTAGCVSDSAAPAAQSGPAASTAPAKPLTLTVKKEDVLIPVAKLNAVQKGMTTEQVRQLLGAADSVQPFRAGAVTGEIWSYRISDTSRTVQVAASMQEVPWFDPVTNKMIMIKEPVYQNQTTHAYHTLEFLMVDGRLIERRPGVDQDRVFN